MNLHIANGYFVPEIVILDNDQVVSPYWWEGYADQYHVATGKSARDLAPDACKGYSDEDLINLSRDSFNQHRNTTQLFFEKFGIDECELYKAYHQYRMETDIPEFFESRVVVNPNHLQELQRLKDLGVKLFILTNGSTEYARFKLDLQGLSNVFNDIVGLDAYPNFHPSKDKKTPEFWEWALARFGIERDQYQQTAFIDDSAGNIEIPKKWRLHTTFMKAHIDNTVPQTITQHDIRTHENVTTDVVAYTREMANRVIRKRAR